MDALGSLVNQTGEQLAWLQEELVAHPIPPGLTPDDWLLWRTRVAEGMTEVGALQSVLEDSLNRHSHQVQAPAPAPPSHFGEALDLGGGQFSVNTSHFNPHSSLPVTNNFGQQQQPHQHQPVQQQQQHQQQQSQQQQQQPHQGAPFGFMNNSGGVGGIDGNMLRPALVQMFSPNVGAGPSSNPAVQMTQHAQQSSPRTGTYTVPMEVPEIWDLTGISSPTASATPPQAPHTSTITTGATSTSTSTSTSASTIASASSTPNIAAARPESTTATSTSTPPQTLSSPSSIPSHSPAPPGPQPASESDVFYTLTVPNPPIKRKSSLRVVPAPRDKQLPTRQPTLADAVRLPDSANNSSSINKPPVIKRTADAKSYMDEIRFLLTPVQLQSNQPAKLFKLLRVRDSEDGGKPAPLFSPSPEEFAYIFQSLYERASDSYLCLMADKEMYTEAIVRWLRRFAKEPDAWEPAIAPLIFMLSRTDMPTNYMKDHRIGSKVKFLAEQAEEMRLRSSPLIQKAYNKYVKYCTEILFPKKRRVGPESDSDPDDARNSKKRKVSPAPVVKPAAPAAKPAAKPSGPVPSVAKILASAPPRPGAKPATKPSGPRTDMSFFSATKPKAPLPSFTKRTAPPVSPVAATGGSSLLASTMKMLKKDGSPPLRSPREDKPAVSFPPKPEPRSAGPKLNKKGHTVKWVDLVPGPPRDFLAIRQFTQEPHEFEPAPWQDDDDVHGMSAHALDKQEGAAMRHHNGVEEEIDWYEPQPYVVPNQQDPPVTAEAEAQEQRERTILAASYALGQTLETGDDSGVIRGVQNDDTFMMYVTPLDNFAPVPEAVPEPAPASGPAGSSVADLLKSISLPGAQPLAQHPQPAYGQHGRHEQPDYNQGYGNQNYNAGRAPHNQHYGNHNAGNHNAGNHNAGHGFNNNNRWGNNRWGPNNRGRGGARGGGQVTCRYWLSGKCFDGDRCRFKHG